MCKCGADAKQQQQQLKQQQQISNEINQQRAEPAIPGVDKTAGNGGGAVWDGDDRNWGGNSSCVSIATGITDYWCATTCAGSSCPMDRCRCDDEAASDKAAKAKELLQKSCDFDTTACMEVGPSVDCRTCALHIEACKASSHSDEDGNLVALTLDDCMDKVSKDVKDCSDCASDDSKEAYKVRLGIGMWRGYK
jgi:hypothetical protein